MKEPRIVRHASVILDLLSAKAGELEEQAHNIEIALKDVRWATTNDDRAEALRDLEEEVAKTSDFLISRGRSSKQPSIGAVAK